MRFRTRKDHYLDIETGLKLERHSWFKTTWDESILAPFGWRLPTLEELLSIIDHKKHTPATKLPGMFSSFYWSSTPSDYDINYAWGIYFDYGNDSYANKSRGHYVRYIKED